MTTSPHLKVAQEFDKLITDSELHHDKWPRRDDGTARQI